MGICKNCAKGGFDIKLQSYFVCMTAIVEIKKKEQEFYLTFTHNPLINLKKFKNVWLFQLCRI